LNEQKIETPKESIADLMRKVIASSAKDTDRRGLRKTPERFEKAIKFLTSGYHQNLDNVLNGATFSVHYDEMVVVKDIEFFSLCEHHLLAIFWESPRRLSAKQARGSGSARSPAS